MLHIQTHTPLARTRASSGVLNLRNSWQSFNAKVMIVVWKHVLEHLLASNGLYAMYRGNVTVVHCVFHKIVASKMQPKLYISNKKFVDL
jgi:hypothetical protein